MSCPEVSFSVTGIRTGAGSLLCCATGGLLRRLRGTVPDGSHAEEDHQRNDFHNQKPSGLAKFSLLLARGLDGLSAMQTEG